MAVVGAREATDTESALAEAVGRELARRGAVVVTGGLGGVMDAAMRGARAGGGATVGILPGHDRAAASSHATVAVATGLGESRNAIVVNAVDALVAVGGGLGTLSEIAFALRAGKRVVGLDTWELARRGQPVAGIEPAADAAAAAERALEAARDHVG